MKDLVNHIYSWSFSSLEATGKWFIENIITRSTEKTERLSNQKFARQPVPF